MGIYRRFKQFILKWDVRPRALEDKATLFIAYLIENGMQSSSVKSYLPAIKKTLVVNGYKWNDARVQVATLKRVCRLINDRVMARFGVHCGLLELMLFQFERKFNQQPYQEIMYKAMFIVGYYRLLGAGELCFNNGTEDELQHTIRAKLVYIATNKEKIILLLYTSKTHGFKAHP